jgi:integrase
MRNSKISVPRRAVEIVSKWNAFRTEPTSPSASSPGLIARDARSIFLTRFTLFVLGVLVLVLLTAFIERLRRTHYKFPHGEGFMRPDPTKPMRTWRTAWRALTKSAGLPAFRFHDLRHHAITELAESRASDQTIMAIAGHLSARMLNHYSHVRLDIRRAALFGVTSHMSALTSHVDYFGGAGQPETTAITTY